MAHTYRLLLSDGAFAAGVRKLYLAFETPYSESVPAAFWILVPHLVNLNAIHIAGEFWPTSECGQNIFAELKQLKITELHLTTTNTSLQGHEGSFPHFRSLTVDSNLNDEF